MKYVKYILKLVSLSLFIASLLSGYTSAKSVDSFWVEIFSATAFKQGDGKPYREYLMLKARCEMGQESGGIRTLKLRFVDRYMNLYGSPVPDSPMLKEVTLNMGEDGQWLVTEVVPKELFTENNDEHMQSLAAAIALRKGVSMHYFDDSFLRLSTSSEVSNNALFIINPTPSNYSILMLNERGSFSYALNGRDAHTVVRNIVWDNVSLEDAISAYEGRGIGVQGVRVYDKE